MQDSCFIHKHYMWDVLLRVAPAPAAAPARGAGQPAEEEELEGAGAVRMRPDESWLAKCSEYASIL